MSLERIRVVLVRPRNAGNVGAAARAMKNMGLRHLVLVRGLGATSEMQRAHEARHVHGVKDAPSARDMAVHGVDVLAAAREVASIEEAVGDCRLVVGTSGRPTARPEGEVSPRGAAPGIVAAAAAGDVALVFGPEDHGLSLEELARCQSVLSIPASSAYTSLNLAQAVLLVAYEIFVASHVHVPRAAHPRAPHADLELMYGKLEEALRRIGFLHADSAPHMIRTLRGLLGRAGLDEREVRICLGIARQIAWAGSFCPGPGRGDVADVEAAPDMRRRRGRSHWVR